MHRTVCVGRDLWWSPSPTPSQGRASPKGRPSGVALHPTGFLVSPRMETAPPLGAPVPAVTTLMEKSFHLLARWSFLGCHLGLLPLVLLLCSSEKSLTL